MSTFPLKKRRSLLWQRAPRIAASFLSVPCPAPACSNGAHLSLLGSLLVCRHPLDLVLTLHIPSGRRIPPVRRRDSAMRPTTPHDSSDVPFEPLSADQDAVTSWTAADPSLMAFEGQPPPPAETKPSVGVGEDFPILLGNILRQQDLQQQQVQSRCSSR